MEIVETPITKPIMKCLMLFVEDNNTDNLRFEGEGDGSRV